MSVCLPQSPALNEAAERGYIPAGACPGGHEPLVKPVAAMAGDRVTVTALGIAVNGEPIAHSAPLDEDSAGRPLRPVPAGAYSVRPARYGCCPDTIRAASTADISGPCR